MKMKIRKHVSMLLLIVCCIPFMLHAQTTTIQGKVIDVHGEAIIGASVTVEGTTNGGITDLDGFYRVKAKPGDYLKITYMGYKDARVKAEQGLTTTLEEDNALLDEVVVVGYGVQKR